MVKGKTNAGIIIPKYFSEPIGDVFKDPNGLINYEKRNILIKNDKDEIIEDIKDVIFPKDWSYLASNTVGTKYFRKAGVPGTGSEKDLRQLVGRVIQTISKWGTEQGYFDEKTAKTLEQELAVCSVQQYGAFNSPVWFNLGLDTYDLKGDETTGESWYVKDGKLTKTTEYLGQASACFIVSPKDTIKSMMKVAAVTSSEIFRRGSGIGGDWSSVRAAGEPISGGGVASGAERFRDVQDAVARVIKSGGKTRRAATMQSIGIWHPDAIPILKHKYQEELKARVLIEAGSSDYWEGHAIQDLRAQNVNLSIRIDDAFWKAYENNEDYELKWVKTGEVKEKVSARSLAKKMAFFAHQCGDPGIQNHTIINDWHTCPNSGPIMASNPCSEYMFIDNSACNLASLNLMRFRQPDGKLDVDSFKKAIDLYITAQDILVSHAAYPTPEIAWNSHIFRPLGLGIANLGAYIMSLGLAYDSNEARDFAASITSLLNAEAYLQSSRLAEKLGVFKEFKKNKTPMLNVMEKHKSAAKKLSRENGLEYLVDSTNEVWKEVLEKGKEFGYRNAQTTLLAPTGTIGFMMDCDTTGCEPELSLKKYKELAGGGFMKIVNQTVPLALERMKYNKKQIKQIINYVNENETIEGCDVLKPEHLSIFDCAISSGKGERFISPMGHIKMLGALQPHLSGAISKTINCPEDTSVEEIENMFFQGWKLGVKAIAIYRNGSKVAQPVKTKKTNALVTLARGEREHLEHFRIGMTQKVRVGGIPLFIRSGEYSDGRLGELFIDSLERGSEVNRLLNVTGIEFSEKIQTGMPLEEAIEVYNKAGQSQISGMTDHEFITNVKGLEGFIFNWLRAHYLGNISFVSKGPDMPERRPLPWELRVYQQVPKLHLIPTVEGEKMYSDVPSLEETIKKISGTNYWCDKEEGLDTRETIEKIKRDRVWKSKNNSLTELSGKMTGKTCGICGNLLISDGKCDKCPSCKESTGGCSS